jgi:hypothetical protein
MTVSNAAKSAVFGIVSKMTKAEGCFGIVATQKK